MRKLSVRNQQVFFHSSEHMGEIKNGTVDLIITSPPYWNLKDYKNKSQIGQENYIKYIKRMNKVWDECYRATKDNALMVINVNSRRNKKKLYPIAFDIYHNINNWKLIDVLIWYIPNALPQPNFYIEKLFDNKFEFLLIFAKNYDYKYTFNKIRVRQKYKGIDNRAGKLSSNGRCIGNIIRIPAYRPPTVKKQNYHIAAYPEELVYFLIHTYSKKDNTILDPFLGSGTTLKVANLLNRKGFGYEINKSYSKIIKSKIKEKWDPPPFEKLDIIHSTAAKPTNKKGRRRPKQKKE